MSNVLPNYDIINVLPNYDMSNVLLNYDMSNVLPDYDTRHEQRGGVSWKAENTYPTGASGLSSTYLAESELLVTL